MTETLFNTIEDFAIIKRPGQLNQPKCLFARSLIIDSADETTIKNILRILRSSHELEMYLKPVFLKSEMESSNLMKQVDGIVSDEGKPGIASLVEKIYARTCDITAGTIQLDYQSAIVQKALQFAYSRKKPLQPYPDRNSKIGYSFPFLSTLFEEDNNLRMLQILDGAIKEELFEGQILDKINLCQNCSGTYLNFRESCSSCHSLDLKAENVIHHFRCAYVGLESDFKTGDDLVCPKCDKTLRHIGIDYDKPSEVNHCNSCGHQSQDSEMKAKCIDCQHEMDLEYIETKIVHGFNLTPKGKQKALQGMAANEMQTSTKTNLQRNGVVDWKVFEIMLKQERERSKYNGKEGWKGILTLDDSLPELLDQRSLQLLQIELNQVIKNYLRPIDILTNKGFQQYIFLLPDIKKKEAELLLDIIQSNVNIMLKDNIGLNQNLVHGELLALQEGFALEFPKDEPNVDTHQPVSKKDFSEKAKESAWKRFQLT